jgi:hypothetical protein
VLAVELAACSIGSVPSAVASLPVDGLNPELGEAAC